jgi:hypothetical protein
MPLSPFNGKPSDLNSQPIGSQ